MPSPPDPSLAPALRRERERTIALLCEHFARDHLETDELEQLIDRAHRATSLAELAALLAPLPALQPPASPAERAYRVARPGEARERRLILAVLDGVERKGSWTPARSTVAVAFMGDAVLDFREARLDPGVTELNVLAFMGGVEIVVPPGIRVESRGIEIMGGFEQVGDGRAPVDTSVPVLRVNGVALMGGVEITVCRPGESARGARQHRREEHRALHSDKPARLRRPAPRDPDRDV